MSKISIIVPVYKVEKYLSKCVDSILAQTYQNLEIILVDDGSPDNCPQICDEYAAIDPRVRVIHQQNSGVSMARNAGLDIAAGDYISFVDGDDWIEPDMYDTLFGLIADHNADVSSLGWTIEKEDSPNSVSKSQNVTCLDCESAIKGLVCSTLIPRSMCGKLFSSHLFQTVRFNADLALGEDIVVLFEILVNVDRFVCMDYDCYHYIFHGGSAIHSFQQSSWTFLQASDMIVDCIKDHKPTLLPIAKAFGVKNDMHLCRIIIENSKLGKKEYRRLLTHIDKYYDCDSKRILSKKINFEVWLLKFGRIPFSIFRWVMAKVRGILK